MDPKELEAELAKNPANLAPTNEPEVKEVQQPVEVKEPEATPEAKTPEPTMEELIGKQEETPKPEAKPETVPLAAFLEIKDELKEVKRALKEAADSRGHVASADVAAIAEEFGVDANFLSQYGKAIAENTKKELEAQFMPLIQKQENEKRARDMEQLFDKVYQDAIAENPELEKVANKNVIKSLAFNPANAKKTVSELLSEAYGNAVQGKATIESARPAPNKDDKPNFASMSPEQLQEVAADPRHAKEYTDYLISIGAFN